MRNLSLKHNGSSSLLTFITIVLFSAALGLGAFTFYYAKGASYLSNDPAACANCHVMNQNYESWMRSGHQHVAKCNDCHVPHDFLGKWLTKFENGMHHSWAFTFKEVPVNIVARQASKDVVQQNCVYCHSSIAGNAAGVHLTNGEQLNCVSCHKGIGHGK